MTNARGFVPWQAKIPLHIRVIPENIAGIVEREIEGVAEATAHKLPRFAFGVYLGQPATGGHPVYGMATRVTNGREEVIFLPDGRQPVSIHLRHVGEVAAHQVDRLLVGRKDHAVGAMFTLTFQRFQQRDLVQFIVAIGVLQPIEATTLREGRVFVVVHHHIQAVERPKQALRIAHTQLGFAGITWRLEADGQFLDGRCLLPRTRRRNGEAV